MNDNSADDYTTQNALGSAHVTSTHTTSNQYKAEPTPKIRSDSNIHAETNGQHPSESDV